MAKPTLLQAFPEDLELVTLPEVFFEIKKTIEDPDSDIPAVADAVSKDPALTAKFLRIANSPMYCRSGSIETISRAVNLLGTQLVHDIVLAASVASAFNTIDGEVFDINIFWRDCISRGVYAKKIAQEIGILDSEHVFIEGLLCAIGQMAMYQAIPAHATNAAMLASDENRLLHYAEDHLLGFNHCAVGQLLAARWGLPESLQVVIGSHQTPGSTEDYDLETACVHIAARLVEGQKIDDVIIDHAAYEITDLDEPSVCLCRDNAATELAESLNILAELPAAA